MLRCSSALRGDPPLCCVAALEARAGAGAATSTRATTDLKQWLHSPQRSMRFATSSAAGGMGSCRQSVCGARAGRSSEEAVASASGRMFQGPAGSSLTSRLRQRHFRGSRLVVSAEGEGDPMNFATEKEKEDWMRRQVRALKVLTTSDAAKSTREWCASQHPGCRESQSLPVPVQCILCDEQRR